MKNTGLSAETIEAVQTFVQNRNWNQFHNPKDLAISISLEAAELLECFQWSGSDTEVASKKASMAEELSDVLIYCIILADRLGLDIDSIVKAKLQKDIQKYPVEKAYGKADKYTSWEDSK